MIYKLEGKLKKENKFKKYIMMGITSILIAFVFTIAIALIIGFRPVIVDGGSMWPTLNYGDIIIIYKVPQNELKVGDILTFKHSENGHNVTHRIIEIDENGDYWTQGDNPNNTPDGYAISYNQQAGKPFVVGKTIYMITQSKTPILHWLISIPNLLAVFAGIVLLSQTNNLTNELLEKNAQYL